VGVPYNVCFRSLSSHPVNGTVKFSSSESMDENVKSVTGSITKTDDVAKHKIPGKGFPCL